MEHLTVPLPPGDDDFADGAASFADIAGLRVQPAVWEQFRRFQAWQAMQATGVNGQHNPRVQPVGQQAAPTAAEVAKVKLPPFWEKDAAAWFKLVEEIFAASNVVDPRARYRQVLLHVPQALLERARGVLNAADTAADPFGELRKRLVDLCTPSKLDQINSIIWGAELGGRRPSELMDAMLAALPPGEADGLLFKGHFLHRLPADIRDQVAVQWEELPSQKLAEFADAIWFARNSQKAAVAAVAAVPPASTEGKEPAGVEELVAALSLNQKRGGRGGQAGRGGRRGRGGQRGSRGGGRAASGKGWLCYKHALFGEQAYHCADTEHCQWSGNE